MKNLCKKILAPILAIILCMGILAGCEQKPAETTKPTETTKPAETQSSETTPSETEPLAYSFEGKTLDVYAGHSANMDGTDLNRFIEDTLGIDILWKVAPSDGGIQALLTERVTPSLFYTGSGTNANTTTYGRYGAYVNLWDYQDLMPNFFALFNDESDPAMVAYKQSYMPSEDELYAAPVFLGGDVQRYAWMYREDIFEANNLEVPTDWDSFLAVCRKLKEIYPDSYPVTMRSNSTNVLYSMAELAQQFGVNYSGGAARDPYTETYYDPGITDEYRNMIRCWRQLIDEGLMDVACLGYDTARWQESFTNGSSFITYDKAFQLSNLEPAGQQLNPDFSLNWFNNVCFFEDADNSVPFQCHDSGVQNYSWIVTSKCADVELALRYLDWLYTDEGRDLMSWGIEGVSYKVDADGNKTYIEGFDTTYMARYQESGLIDFNATLSAYPEKCQEMILDTMASAAAGGWEKTKTTLAWNNDEQLIMDTYNTGWTSYKSQHLAKFMLGDLDINSDTDWNAYIEGMAVHHVDEILACYNAAYQRFLAK